MRRFDVHNYVHLGSAADSKLALYWAIVLKRFIAQTALCAINLPDVNLFAL